MTALLTAMALLLVAPPARPGAGTAEERARLLVDAIRKDQPELADPFFFPRAEFPRVKGIKDPDAYFRVLLKVYHADIRLLRSKLKQPDSLELVSFELGGWKRWVERGKEANRRPYWAAYKSPLIVRDAGKRTILPVRVMISWEGQWYVTHLTRKTAHEKPDPKLLPRPAPPARR